MDLVLLIARLGLAAVFAIAGIAKLMDIHGSRRAVQAFGVPASLAGPVGVVLPIAELVIAIGLVPRATAWWAAIGALGLLGLFVAGIAVNLARGKAPECHCFGQLHSEPVGTTTLIRNGGLAAIALTIVGFGWRNPGESAVAWIGELTTSEQIVGTILALQFLATGLAWWLALHLLGQNGRLLNRMDTLEATMAERKPRGERGLPVGSVAPEFFRDGLDGQTVTLGGLRALGKPVLTIFTDPNCPPCMALVPDIARWQRDLADSWTVAVIASGTADDNRAKAAEHAIEQVLLDPDRETALMYGSAGTPAAVVIRPDGTIGTPLAAGAEEIRRLMPAAVTLLPAVGSLAPSFSLPDLDGTMRSLTDFPSRDRVLLFWNPGCGFCQRMLPDLRAWLDARPVDALEVVLISSGSVEANRAMNIDSPILLDPGFNTGRAFGSRGTPAAVRIGADGTIASKFTVRSPAILSLLGAIQPRAEVAS